MSKGGNTSATLCRPAHSTALDGIKAPSKSRRLVTVGADVVHGCVDVLIYGVKLFLVNAVTRLPHSGALVAELGGADAAMVRKGLVSMVCARVFVIAEEKDCE